MRRASALLALAACLLITAAPLSAQSATRAISVVLIGSDGVPLEPIEASDMQVSLSRGNESLGSDGSNMASITLDVAALSDPKLLTWIGKGGEDDSILITVESRYGGTVYLLSGVVSRNVSVSHSTSSVDGSVSVSLGAKHLTINGYGVN